MQLHKFENYKSSVQEMICVANHLGSLMQYETVGFLPNKRMHRGKLGKYNLNIISLAMITVVYFKI